MVFLELWREAWGSFQVATGNSGTPGTRSCCLREVGSLLELRGARWDPSRVAAGE